MSISCRARVMWPLALAGTGLAQSRRPNILFVAVDDLNTDLGCYGHPIVQTPNLDRLARRGVRFERAYCQYPVCNPSRTSFLSGFYPETTRVLDNRTNPRSTLKDAVFMPEFFRRQGYTTARVGKIYHDGNDGPGDWDISLDPRPAPGVGRKGEGRNLTAGKFGFFQWLAAEGTDQDQPDGLIADEAVRLLKEKREKPLFLGVGLRKPHDPYIAPKKYFEPYPLEKFATTPGPEDDEKDIPPSAYPPVRHNLGPLEGREYRRAYAACTSFMDAQLGRVLDAAPPDTIVVFFGDHGLHLGEHGWWNKVTLFERSARVPMVVVAPGVTPAGAVCRRPVELMSLYPTLAQLAGLQPPKMQAQAFTALLRNPDARWHRPAYTVVSRGPGLGRAIRNDRYAYTEWEDGKSGFELYDHAIDPHEYTNLAGRADSAGIERQMKAALAAVRSSLETK